MATDPVCGMTVDEKSAEHTEYRGKTYSFCSTECKQKFDRNPEQYTSQSAA